MKYQRLLFWLSVGIVVGNVLYWVLAFAGVSTAAGEVELVPGHTAWFWSFPLPDLWCTITAALMALSIKTKREAMAAVCALLTASGIIFLSLNEICFGIYTGMFFLPLQDIWIDLVIKITNLAIGAFFIKQFSGELSKTLVKSWTSNLNQHSNFAPYCQKLTEKQISCSATNKKRSGAVDIFVTVVAVLFGRNHIGNFGCNPRYIGFPNSIFYVGHHLRHQSTTLPK